MIISINWEKAFHKIQDPFMIKNTQQSGNRGSICQHNKSHIWKIHCQHNTQQEKFTIIPLNIGNKTGMDGLTSLIQHSTGSPSHSNQTRRRNKRYPNCKGKLSSFADDRTLYINNPKDSMKKLLELINEFSEVAGYTINIQKSVAFLYTNNKL